MTLLLIVAALLLIVVVLLSPWFWRHVFTATRDQRWYQGLPHDHAVERGW
ncbi:MAG: hypothetical protein AB7Q29_19590 [Vicinamibacterales bacterium]